MTNAAPKPSTEESRDGIDRRGWDGMPAKLLRVRRLEVLALANPIDAVSSIAGTEQEQIENRPAVLSGLPLMRMDRPGARSGHRAGTPLEQRRRAIGSTPCLRRDARTIFDERVPAGGLLASRKTRTDPTPFPDQPPLARDAVPDPDCMPREPRALTR
jgi:hypothetical protein